MQLKHPEVVIPPDSPFANDKLEREKCSQTLTNLVTNLPGPFVLSINGGWGTGKTTFLKMWKQHLKNESFTEIYFSAWEDDYCDDALVALIGQIWKHLKESDFKEIVNSIKECAAPVFRTGVFNAVKNMTAGVVELNEGQLKSRSEKIIDDYIDSGKNLKELKKRLGQLAQEVVAESGKPLVVIIDELDRCRPLFAIELLEKIKHLFDIPGIIFVLGLDREQLGHSIKSVYGQEMNVDGYLQRFIDMDFILSTGSSKGFTHFLVSRFGLDAVLNNDLFVFERIHPALVDLFNLSLRDQEQCFRILTTALSSPNLRGVQLNTYLLSFLSVLKIAKPKVYLMVSKKQYNGPDDLINILLKESGGQDMLNSKNGRKLEAYLIVIADKYNLRSQLHSEPERAMVIKEAVSNRLAPYVGDQMNDLLNLVKRLISGLDPECIQDIIPHISERIELASLMVKSDHY